MRMEWFRKNPSEHRGSMPNLHSHKTLSSNDTVQISQKHKLDTTISQFERRNK